MKRFLTLAAVGLLAGAIGASALPSASAPSFARPRSYGTPCCVVAIAAGDFNADGELDLAGAGGNNVFVFLNGGNGSFQAAGIYVTGATPESVAIGDLNGDGNPDLTTANGNDSSVSVLFNRGDGTFEPKHDYAVGSGSGSVATGDLNGDGKLDLAAANTWADSTVSVLLNRGDGSFEPRRWYATGGIPTSVAIGDLSGDGKPDLVTANRDSNTVSVLLNRGGGHFRARRDYRSGCCWESVGIGDLNGDGSLDLATSGISVLLNRGDGTFRAFRAYGAAGAGGSSLAIGDLNADGKPDLATANYPPRGHPGTVSVLVNTGNGGFQGKVVYRVGGGTQSIALGDLNGDGKPDLATNGRSISVLLNTPGLCTVQEVRGRKLPVARRITSRANCRVGQIRRAYSKRIKRGRVIWQKPRFGTVPPGGAQVDLVVSRGRRQS